MARRRPKNQPTEGQFSLFDFLSDNTTVVSDNARPEPAPENTAPQPQPETSSGPKPLIFEPEPADPPAATAATRVEDQEPVSEQAAPESPSAQPIASAPSTEPRGPIDLASGGADSPVWYDPDFVPPRTPRPRINANLTALETLNSIISENDRPATASEQAILAAYTGWGGLSDVFDPANTRTAPDREQLRALLDSDATYNALSRTVTSAYYTPNAITEAVWKGLRTAGLPEDAWVMEPGSGTGRFIHSAPDNANVVGVESDPVSATIARKLYPNATIINDGYERLNVADSSFAAAVGNVPFLEVGLNDPAHNPTRSNYVHNHFLIKALRGVAPGGYAALISTAGTADSAGDHRRTMAETADLISAYRLPTNTFAGTRTATDLMIFRVREPGQAMSETTEQFLHFDTLEFVTPDDDGQPQYNEYRLNAYFASHPDHIMGEASVGTGRFGAPTLTVQPRNGDINESLRDLDALIQRDISTEVRQGRGFALAPLDSPEITTRAEYSQTVEGQYRYTRDTETEALTFERLRSGTWDEVNVSRGADAEEWASIIDLGNLAQQLQAEYESPTNPEAMHNLQAALSDAYDVYSATYGPLNRFTLTSRKPTQSQAKKAFTQLAAQWRTDNDLGSKDPLPQDVEDQLSEEANQPAVTQSRKHLGDLTNDPSLLPLLGAEDFNDETGEATKSAFFTTNTARRTPPITHADTLAEAVNVTFAATGSLDVAAIARLANEDIESVAEALPKQRLAFRDPANPDRFIRANEYLSGFVVDKLDQAEAAAEDDLRLVPNVEALTEVRPARVEDGISFRPGQTWLPEDFYTDFLVERFGLNRQRLAITRAADTWNVDYAGTWEYGGQADMEFGLIAAGSTSNPQSFNFAATGEPSQWKSQAVACNRNDGVAVTALRTFETCMNLGSPTVNFSKEYKEDHPSENVHPQATAFMGRRTAKLRQEFGDWVSQSPERRQRAVDIYNEKFNSFVPPTHDGSERQLDGLGNQFVPYPYQRDAVERIASEPAVLLNHVVGAGKTGTMFMGAMELKRHGLIQQPWMVVPNHIAGQITREFSQWYPTKRVLSAAGVANAEDRRRFLAQAQASDWDMVILPQSVFSRINVDKDTEAAYKEAQVDELRQEMLAAREADASKTTIRDIERALISLEEQLESLLEAPADEGTSFNATRCDYLIVDEAHDYKNLFRASKIQDINQAPGSKRASDLDMKLGVIRNKITDAGMNPWTTPHVTFATGTPIANNLAEIWVMAKYLRPDVLAKIDSSTVNAWAATFTDQVADVEVNASGTKLQNKVRTAAFLNVGDLANASRMFMDVVTKDQIPAKLPTLNGGSNRIVEFDSELETTDLIADLQYRTEYNWGSQIPKEVNPARIDNPLTVLGHARLATLHPGLAGLDVDETPARLDATVRHIVQEWQDSRDNIYTDDDGEASPNPGALQIVFCDQSTPKDGQLNFYDALRDELTANGMDRDRIRFVQDYDSSTKQSLFSDCKNGHVDVLIGSTATLGTGANIQKRAIALYHVDVPWRPADLEQREGRIMRQGNQNDNITIYNMIGRGTSDANSWQTVYRKQRFINQFAGADRSLRSFDNTEASSSDTAAVNKALATGDPRYLELNNLDREVERLEQEEAEYQATKDSVRHTIEVNEQLLRRFTPQAEAGDQFAAAAEAWAGLEEPEYAYGTVTTTDRNRTANHLSDRLERVFRTRNSETILTLGDLHFQATYGSNRYSDVGVNVHISGYEPASTFIPLSDMEGRPLNQRNDGSNKNEDGTTRSTDTARGLLRRIENLAYRLPERQDKLISELQTYQATLERSRAKQTPDFPKSRDLAQAVANREKLREQLREAENSPEAKKRAEEREKRNEVKGRTPGWSLRLKPTPGYAEWIARKDQSEVIAQQKFIEKESLHRHGLLDDADYARAIRDFHDAVPESLDDDASDTDLNDLNDFLNGNSLTAMTGPSQPGASSPHIGGVLLRDVPNQDAYGFGGNEQDHDDENGNEGDMSANI